MRAFGVLVGADLGDMIWASERIRSLGGGESDSDLDLIQDGTQATHLHKLTENCLRHGFTATGEA